tara:strand:- start:2570 stop:3301 length:732 start_codon:yes stop_codon:yes gene_type:complete
VSKIQDILKSLNRRQRVASRKEAFSALDKFAQEQHGIFQHFRAPVTDYKTRERLLAMRGGGEMMGRDTESLYGIGPEHETSYVPTEYVAPHLSTRYSPDRVGVQARRVGDGIYQDPYTNKVYDYNEGFKTEDGRGFPGGSAAFQTDLVFASENEGNMKKIAANRNYNISKAAGKDPKALVGAAGTAVDRAEMALTRLANATKTANATSLEMLMARVGMALRTFDGKDIDISPIKKFISTHQNF